ncbi:MAG: hypothetical protein EKK61_00825 [Rickettsiales bacterium]|nr:MAG: hypothetical protein EKK61_00825 [Rickettsiales bacterium]
MSPRVSDETEKIFIKKTSKTKYSENKFTSFDISKNKKNTEEAPKKEIKSKISLSKSNEENVNVSKFLNSIKDENSHNEKHKKESLLKIITDKVKKFIKNEQENNDVKNDLHTISLPLPQTKEAKSELHTIHSEPISVAHSSFKNKPYDKNPHSEHHRHSVVTVNDLLGAINTNGSDQYELMKYFLPPDIVDKISIASQPPAGDNVDFMGGINFNF